LTDLGGDVAAVRERHDLVVEGLKVLLGSVDLQVDPGEVRRGWCGHPDDGRPE
jgi:hypothetical protein